ncbi:vanillate O-demethylase ferredoxin subunit [Collimonas sp. OK307]|uniref:PepSY domain-containing protein n=1 Tax=Collimonas sp. OK307 TaxID=1801620 RepID=UPI0008EC9DD7|nr:vanillate O-demethylase ferredoxin subunit [Collimonas sp. OK307]
MNTRVRNSLLSLHRWTGFTVGLVIVLMALTGAAIMYRPQLEPLLSPDLLTVPACSGLVPLDALTAAAAAVRPAAKLDYIRLVAGDAADAGTDARMPAAMVRFTDQTFVYLNPCNGEVLGQRHRYGGLLGTIEQIHRFRFMKNGNLITGTSAIVFGLVLILAGLYIWLPATLRGVRSALKFNGRLKGPARTINLHKTVGFYVSLILLTSVLTGLPQAFDWYKNGIYTIAGSAPAAKAPKSQPAAGAQRLSMEAMWQRAQEYMPHPQEILLHYPDKPRDAVEMYLIANDAPHPNARTMLYLDAYSGKTLKYIPYADSSLGSKLYFWTLSLHTGHIGGPVVQLLLMAAALSVPFLAYTGIATWLRRRKRATATRRLRVRVARKINEAEGIWAFELVDPKGRALPRFSAGAHIDVYLRNGLVRQYSLCNDPGESHRYLICVQLEQASRGGSRAMHENIKEGHVIEIGIPKNRFAVDPTARRSVLIAGGIGVTPILCMAEHLAGLNADFEMHYCTRTRQRTAFLNRIKKAVYADRVTFHFSDRLAQPRRDFMGLIGNFESGTHLYVCGPAGFVNMAIDAARQRGWPDRNVHKEYFSAEMVKAENDTGFDIKLASTGKVLHVAKGKSVLEVLSDCGVDIPRSCEQGVCGTCMTRVLAGVPDHRDVYLSDEERIRNDRFIPCCSRARSDMLVLDL